MYRELININNRDDEGVNLLSIPGRGDRGKAQYEGHEIEARRVRTRHKTFLTPTLKA